MAEQRQQLCWRCQNACGGCNWSARLEPVPGWTATPHRRIYRDAKLGKRIIDSYIIKSCPQFIPD